MRPWEGTAQQSAGASWRPVSDDAPRLLTLNDGRQLAYAEHGVASRWPRFFFQGTPSSRLIPRPAFPWTTPAEC